MNEEEMNGERKTEAACPWPRLRLQRKRETRNGR